MKQYKLIIKEDWSENLGTVVNSQAKGGWKLNSYESSKSNAVNDSKIKERIVLVFEK